MPKTAIQNKQIKDERRQSILDASLPLFGLYHNLVTIDQICEKAKCSHGLIYHYFKNTKDVLEALMNTKECLSIKKELDCNIDKPTNERVEEITKSLLKINNINRVSYLSILIKDDSKKSFKNDFIKLVNKEQLDIKKSNDLVDIYLSALKGLYYNYLIDTKHEISSLKKDALISIFKKGS